MTKTETTEYLEWKLAAWIPDQMSKTTNARRLASLRKQRDEAQRELAAREGR